MTQTCSAEKVKIFAASVEPDAAKYSEDEWARLGGNGK
jgi:hypothetical protein